jgi:uncharacterized membrane protein
MANFEIAVEIQAPAAYVWAVLVDVERWPEWSPTVTSIERLDPGPLALGSRTRIHQPKLRPAVWQVTELNEAQGVFTWAAKSPGILVTARHLVAATGSGSKAILTTEFSGFLAPLLMRPLRELNEQYVTTEAQSLKKRCES